MTNKILVAGASGHIGNNLVRTLAQNGEQVTAGVRRPESAGLFDNLGCETVNIDLLDKNSLIEALRGIDTLYQAGTAFRYFTTDPEINIYRTSLQGCRNVIEAAAETGVRRVVYVSSLAALDRSTLPISENTWNPGTDNIYIRSRAETEKLAWELADKLGLEMISALPGATIGMNCFRMTLAMRLLKAVLEGTLAVDPGFYFNFIHVEDVVSGILAAADRGQPGERYLLANEEAMSVREVVALAQEILPERNIRSPVSLPRSLLWVIVAAMEANGGLDGTEPELTASSLTEYTRREQCDISKARQKLDFRPASPRRAVLRTLHDLDALLQSAPTDTSATHTGETSAIRDTRV